jgi:hypothetical protein
MVERRAARTIGARVAKQITVQRVGDFARPVDISGNLDGKLLYRRAELRVELASGRIVTRPAPDRERKIFYVQRLQKRGDD